MQNGRDEGVSPRRVCVTFFNNPLHTLNGEVSLSVRAYFNAT